MADLRLAGDAARRAAESLLRGVGGRMVYLRLTAAASASQVNEQIGLGVPKFQDAELSPVVFRKAKPQLKTDGPRWELMVSAISVAGLLGALDVDNSSQVDITSGAGIESFSGAAGIVVDGVLMQIESVSTSDMSGTPYVYRLLLRTSAAGVI